MAEYDLGQVVGSNGRGISNISVSGSVMTITYDDNTTQDVNVVESDLSKYIKYTDIINDLEHNEVDKPLSAKQGKALKQDIENKSKVSFSKNLNDGTKIGTLTIDGVTMDLFAPTPESGSDIVVEETVKATSENPVKSKGIYNFVNSNYVSNNSFQRELNLKADSDDLNNYMKSTEITTNYAPIDHNHIGVHALTEHSHGGISSNGRIGQITSSGKPLITGESGIITVGSFGEETGQFAEGDHQHEWVADTRNQKGVCELFTNESIHMCVLYVYKTIDSVSETKSTTALNVVLPNPPKVDYIYSNSTHTTHNMRLTKEGVVEVLPGAGTGPVAVNTQFMWHY